MSFRWEKSIGEVKKVFVRCNGLLCDRMGFNVRLKVLCMKFI